MFHTLFLTNIATLIFLFRSLSVKLYFMVVLTLYCLCIYIATLLNDI